MTSEEIRAHVLLMFGSLGLLRVDCETPTHNSVDSDAAAAGGFGTPLALWNFVARIETGYNDNPYHNFRHAVDVTHTVYRYVTITEPRTHVTHVEKFALLVAALSHDLDHPGVNNAFLVNTKDRLATLYNDSSVLENSHIAFLYDLIATRQTRHAAVATRRPRPGALPRSDTLTSGCEHATTSPSVEACRQPRGAFPSRAPTTRRISSPLSTTPSTARSVASSSRLFFTPTCPTTSRWCPRWRCSTSFTARASPRTPAG